MKEELLTTHQTALESGHLARASSAWTNTARSGRVLLLAALALSVGGCSLFSGYREVPASHMAKEQLEVVSNSLPMLSQLEEPDRPSITFVAAFDGTLNDRMHVPRGEDTTVVAKLYYYVQAPDMADAAARTSKRAKVYFKGPGCPFGVTCAADAAFGYSSMHTANAALKALQLFVNERPAGGDLHVVVTGFSRGAATARHFLNLVHKEGQSGFLKVAGLRTRSHAILIDTVATGDEGPLQLSLPSTVEMAIHYVAINEARPLFKSTTDEDPVFEAVAHRLGLSIRQRIWTFRLPGAHSDLGDSYLRGVGPVMTVNAMVVMSRLGLGAPITIDLCSSLSRTGQAGGNCRTLDEGLHDSRGFLDRLRGVGSPYACGFQRADKKVEMAPITEPEAEELAARIRASVFSLNASMGPGSDITKSQTQNYVFKAAAKTTQWTTVYPKVKGYEGYVATVTRTADGGMLELTDVHNAEKRIPIPADVFRELERRQAPAEVELHVAMPGGPWWFVDGCIPAEK